MRIRIRDENNLYPQHLYPDTSLIILIFTDGSADDSDAVVSGEESAAESGELTPVSDLATVTRRAAADLGVDGTVQLDSGAYPGTYEDPFCFVL
jgi:hypothetical protein